jgi:hypothetical protein
MSSSSDLKQGEKLPDLKHGPQMDKSFSDMSKEELLQYIAKLEAKNKELSTQVKSKELIGFPKTSEVLENLKRLQESASFPSITSADVYDNLKRFQDTFMERFGHKFNAYRTGFDLTPFLEAAARSRGLAESAISMAPIQKRQLFVCVISFLLLPSSMLISTITVFLALYFRSPILVSCCILYGAYIYLDQNSCEQGAKGTKWFKQSGWWKNLR